MAGNERGSWEKDFADYISTELVEVPASLSERVLGGIGAELNPSALSVFGKVSLVQFLGGLSTLLFCPQFGLSLSSSLGLMPYLMRFGESFCMLGCGALFTGFSLLIVSFTLRPEEIRILKKHEIVQLISVSTLSLGAFLCLGGEVVLALGLVWLLGAVIGGALTLKIGWGMRKKLFWGIA